jgi:hypothetical protein
MIRTSSAFTFLAAAATLLQSYTAAAEQTKASTPALTVTPPERVVFSGPEGGPFYPSFYQYHLVATAGRIDYSIRTPSWLASAVNFGTTDMSGRTITVLISKRASDLKPGTYGPGVTFINVTNGRGSVTRPAVLIVQPRESPSGASSR